ncbi:MAG: cold shock domain-containing protein [bacterium]
MKSEPLDFCRVKKIDEKGFGFLKSLYYENDIFFHFSQIKKEEFREKLEEMKRGEFFLFFTSLLQPNGKRKVSNIWYLINDIPKSYHIQFKAKIIEALAEGKTNLYDLLYVFVELKKLDLISKVDLNSILMSKRIMNLPTTILPFLNSEEINEFKIILNMEKIKNLPNKPYWFDDVYNYNKNHKQAAKKIKVEADN